MAKVKMRFRTIVNNRKSILLDYSPPFKNPSSGKFHRFETLKLYIYDSPVDQWERQHNKETMVLARSICAQRQLDIQNRRFGFISDALKDSSFIDFFQIEARKKQHSVSDNWGMCLRYFIAFAGHDLKFPELNDYLCEDYKNYLLKIEYIESMEDYIKIHLKTEKTVLTLMTLKKVLALLPEQRFKRIHRNYIVSVAAIKSIQHKKLQLAEATLPIGDSYAEQVKAWLKDF